MVLITGIFFEEPPITLAAFFSKCRQCLLLPAFIQIGVIFCGMLQIVLAMTSITDILLNARLHFAGNF
jgi:hypothetical protein